MPTAAWIATLGLWALWWLWFVLSGQWLRRKGEPVPWTLFSWRGALALLVPAAFAALGIAANDPVAYSVFAVSVVTPYVVVLALMLRRN